MSDIYTSNKIVPISEHIPISKITSENKFTKFILEGIGWTGSILVLCPYVIYFEITTGLLIVCIKSKQVQSIVLDNWWNI